MSLGIYFPVQGMSPERYDETIRRLNAAGQGKPKGRLYHAAFATPDGLQVFDVWENEADFQAFGETLMPILGELGINPGQPMISPIHSIITP